MEHWVEHVSEPTRLLLAWQASDDVGDRQRWAVGELLNSADGVTLRYFVDKEFEAYNFEQPFSKVKSYGFRGHAAFPLRPEAYNDGVLEAFMRRLPPRTRVDFERYRAHLRLRPETQLSDFALLGLSEAQLPSDGFSVVDPLDQVADRCELVNELAGYRYYLKNHGPPDEGAPIVLLPEPENPYDANAVRATIDGETIGYINRLQAPTFLRWIEERRVSAAIDRLNGRPEHPRAFIFVRVVPRQSE